MTDKELEELFNRSIKKALDEIKKEFEKLIEVNSKILETRLKQFKIEFNNLLKQGLKVQLQIPRPQILPQSKIIVPTLTGAKSGSSRKIQKPIK